MRSTIRALRGTASVSLFIAFGIGALLISPPMALLPRREWGLALVRLAWRPLVFLFQALGLIRIDRNNLRHLRGAVIAANHPSFIDVVLLSVLMPRTFAVAKHALKRNPFMAMIVRKATLPDDARLIDVAGGYLAKGWNVLVFPEGTRSPANGMHPFHRGAVQLALRTKSPLAAVGIVQSERIMAKGQRPWEVGTSRVAYAFRMDLPREQVALPGETMACAARRLTAELEGRIRNLIAPRAAAVETALEKAALVIPVYNPESGLKPLCEKVAGKFGHLIVVDDGSVADRQRFDELPAEVTLLKHAVNRGKGAAIKTALGFLKSCPIDTVVFADGDGQHRVQDILTVAARAERDDAVVFGARDFSGKNVPFRSWWGNRWTAWEVRLFLGFNLADTQTGLRAIPARLLSDVAALKGERFEYEARLFRFLRHRGEPIVQVPVETIYRNNNSRSHFRPLADTVRTQLALLLPN